MRIAYNEEELKKGFEAAGSEAEASFGNKDLYIEKFVSKPRHIEVQIFCDSRGNGIYLGERDCSVQRKHQKLIEESPSPAVNADLRRKLGEAAVRGALAVGYDSAGTVEFLMDEKGSFCFIEMNTRIQVEHPVTEMVTGIDIVKEQVRIAAGEPLSIRQEDVHINGHAIECRINAEDVDKDFAPCPGKIDAINIPGGPGIRVDTHAYAHYVIPPFYDSLLAKLVAHAPTRDECIARMLRTLEEFVVEGVSTTVPFHVRALDSPLFRSGRFDTSFVSKFAEKTEGESSASEVSEVKT